MKFELYKIFKKKIVLILIAISLLWGGFSVLYPALQYTTYTEQMERVTGIAAIHYDRDLQNRYAGQYSFGEMASLYEEYERIYHNPDYQRPTDGEGYSFSSAGGNTSPLTDEAYYQYLNRYSLIALVGNRTKYLPLYVEDAKATGNLQELYYGSIVQSGADDNLLPPASLDNPVVQKVLGMYNDLQLSFYGEYSKGWESFFNTVPLFFSWFVGLIIMIGVVPVFAEERSSGSDKVLLTTRYGKSRLIRNKIAACFLYATIVFAVFVSFLVLAYIGIYGTSGLRASIQLLAHCNLSPYNLSIGGALIGWGLLGWGAALLTAAGAMMFSALAANTFGAFIPSLIGYVVPTISFAGLSPSLHRIMQLLPVNTIGAIDRFFSMPDFYTIFGVLIEKKAVCIIVWTVLIVLCTFLSALIFKNKKISN